jgi:hypothetical protein
MSVGKVCSNSQNRVTGISFSYLGSYVDYSERQSVIQIYVDFGGVDEQLDFAGQRVSV